MNRMIPISIWTKSRKLTAILTVAALAIIGASYSVLGKDKSYANVPRSGAPVPVSVMTIEPATIESVVTAAGTLSSKNTSVLSSKVMGRVAVLSVQEGDRVEQGRLLMKIDSGEIAAQTYQAKAAFNTAQLQFDRVKVLFDQRASTQMEMDQATLGLESARAGLNAAKAMESYTMITAPINGQIVEKRINVGEMALPGQPLLRIEDNRNLRLDVTVKEQDLAVIRTGMRVAVRIDALPDREIRGQVTQIVPAADVRTHSFIVKIDIPADRSLITGMYGKAFFDVGSRKTVLIPRSSLVEMSGLSGVYLVSPEGQAVFQLIQPGEVRDDRIEAVSGLKPGDTIVVSRHAENIDGKKVTATR